MNLGGRTSILALTIGSIVALGACSYSRQIRLVQEQHAGASFEATAYGCDLTRRAVTRRFPELAAAVAWGRGVATFAPADRTCDVSIDALSDSTRQPVYLVRRDFKGVWTVGPSAEF
jgi:hypothetical protein